jgi:hypothetical protein
VGNVSGEGTRQGKYACHQGAELKKIPPSVRPRLTLLLDHFLHRASSLMDQVVTYFTKSELLYTNFCYIVSRKKKDDNYDV